MGEFYLDPIEYYLPQDKGHESNPITLWQYLANITVKTGKYARDKLFHAISHDKNPTTVHFVYFPHNKVLTTQVLNRLPCILSEELIINPNDSITRSGIEQATMGIWDKKKRTLTNPNELHNEEAMEVHTLGFKICNIFGNTEPTV